MNKYVSHALAFVGGVFVGATGGYIARDMEEEKKNQPQGKTVAGQPFKTAGG